MNKKAKCILLIIVSFIIGVISVYSLNLCNAKDILYDSSDNNWNVETIEDALNDLYENKGNNTCNVNVAKPNLGNKLIPVTIADDGTVTYADVNTKWYDYCNKIWANAVLLIDNPSKQYNVGETIGESDIESYFVWIPKYKYKLWNVESTETSLTAVKGKHSIEIEFDTSNTTDIEGKSCVTPMTSGNSGNCNNGEWMTHPAFISLDVNGFWIGKFETGYKGATSIASAEANVNDSSKVIIKPNVYSWRNITVSNMFRTAYNYERGLDSHLIKNTEWGAVAYLSHSIYGINYEININNNNAYKTGYSSLLNLQQGIFPGTSGDGANYNKAYNTEIGYLASTTGNISGVYDMSGGAHEYMASYVDGYGVGESGFTSTELTSYIRYFDKYLNSSTVKSWNNRILGDATGEMGPFVSYKNGDGWESYHSIWYGDFPHFVESSNPWFHRGGYHSHGLIGGQFYSGHDYGGVRNHFTIRVVLSPSN